MKQTTPQHFDEEQCSNLLNKWYDICHNFVWTCIAIILFVELEAVGAKKLCE